MYHHQNRPGNDFGFSSYFSFNLQFAQLFSTITIILPKVYLLLKELYPKFIFITLETTQKQFNAQNEFTSFLNKLLVNLVLLTITKVLNNNIIYHKSFTG